MGLTVGIERKALNQSCTSNKKKSSQDLNWILIDLEVTEILSPSWTNPEFFTLVLPDDVSMFFLKKFIVNKTKLRRNKQ